ASPMPTVPWKQGSAGHACSYSRRSFPTIESMGMGPNRRLSRELSQLSPMTNTVPIGISTLGIFSDRAPGLMTIRTTDRLMVHVQRAISGFQRVTFYGNYALNPNFLGIIGSCEHYNTSRLKLGSPGIIKLEPCHNLALFDRRFHPRRRHPCRMKPQWFT